MGSDNDIPVACSAPGKVLFTGGYLVLDRQYTGLVFGLDARIYVYVQALSESTSTPTLVVRSPQFQDAEWRYGYRKVEDNGGIQATQLKTDSECHLSRNKFVEATLTYALSYISSLQPTTLGSSLFTIWADKDYYSTPGMPKGRFVDFKVPLHEAHKTGLGSSAALVTAFTAATLAYYLPPDIFSLASGNGRTKLHNLAQAAHCSAQGKVGSGFDVAAAAYGSCVYRRFSPKVLEEIGEPGEPGFSTRLRAVTDDTSPHQKWDTSIDEAAAIVPKGLLLVMCDVDCGSETVGMVKKVLNWRKERPEEATPLWSDLQRANENLGQQLRSIASTPTSSGIQSLRTIILTIRSLIRQMSVKAGVPVEPPVVTALIDACSDLPGVVGGMVPGAGGYDAVALLVEDKEEALSGLQEFLARYRSEGNENDGGRIGKVRLLGVKQEHEGVRMEDVGHNALADI